MGELQHRCVGCFRDKGEARVCPSCGFDEGVNRPALLLPFRTVLDERYVIGRELGAMSGFTITYLAWDLSLNERVAIKEFLPPLLAGRDDDGVTVRPHSDADARFFRSGVQTFGEEAQRLARFHHDNIVRVLTCLETNGTAYMIMDLYSGGETLEGYLGRQGGRISQHEALQLIGPILEALESEVHAQQFLHLDISPQNIYLASVGTETRPMLLDFGAARRALGESSLSLPVTLRPGYSPLEQYNRQGKQGSWTDVYACAATLYRCVTGVVPPPAIDRLARDLLMAPQKLASELSSSFCDAVLWGLGVARRQRPQTVAAFRKRLFDQPPSGEQAMQVVPPEDNTRAGRVLVFISYSHDSEEHKQRVLELADRLRFDGVDAQLDQYEQAPPVGWPQWMLNQIEEASFVLVVCTEIYERRFSGKEAHDQGLQATWQGAILRQALYEARAYNTQLIPVTFAAGDAAHVPLVLKGATRYDLETEEGYEALYRRLTGQPLIRRPDLGPVRSLPPAPRGRSTARPESRPSDSEDRPAGEDAQPDLGQALTDTYRRKVELEVSGGDTAPVLEKILALKRRLREGGQLQQGDLLSGRFKLLQVIGQGGFATVWKAVDRARHALVAVKVLHGQYRHDRSRRQRFFRGARKMAELHHQAIVRVIEEKAEDEGWSFFVMEYLAGGNLRQAVQSGRLTLEDRLRILLEVGDAVAFAHQKEIVHRDLKPANILLDQHDRPKLTDFDLVRAPDTTGGTRTSMLGTVIYAAPEMMAQPKDAGKPADVYGFGMTLAFALHGKDLPLDAMRDSESFVASLDASPEIQTALARAVAWAPEERWGSVSELCAALQRALGPRESIEQPGKPARDLSFEQATTQALGDSEDRAPDPGKPIRRENSPRSWRGRARLFAAVAVPTAFILSGLALAWWSVTSNKSNILLAQDDASQTRAGQEVIIPVLWNDQVPAGASLSITRPPGRGTASKNGDGTVTYQPDSDFHQGSDEFTYTVADGTQTAMAMVAIEVKPRRAFSPTTAPRSGEVRTHRKDGLAYAWIPPAQEGQKGFWLGQTEVTVGTYRDFAAGNFRKMATLPRGSTEFHPVVSVNWNDAQAFCQWSGGRLPTAMEWEHAARGGLEDPIYPWGDDDLSCSREDPNGAAGRPRTCKLSGPLKVGSYQANGYGLYDMAGNAAEWCYAAAARNKKVVKGGSFRDKNNLKIATRASAILNQSYVFVGFRCLREDPPEE